MKRIPRRAAVRLRRNLALSLTILQGTPRLRIVGGRTLLTYERALSDGILLRVRFGVKSDEIVIDDVYTQKVYEREFRIVKGSVVVDVGANIGAFSTRASRLVGDMGRVVAIEPEGENFRLLKENLERNHCRNVLPVRLALGAEPGKATLNVYKMRGSHSLYNNPGETLVRKEMIRVETLDNLVTKYAGGQIDFLKIDAEGAEQIILLGGEISIRKSRPRIAMETHPFGSSVEEMTSFLRGFDYSIIHNVGKFGLGLLYALPGPWPAGSGTL